LVFWLKILWLWFVKSTPQYLWFCEICSSIYMYHLLNILPRYIILCPKWKSLLWKASSSLWWQTFFWWFICQLKVGNAKDLYHALGAAGCGSFARGYLIWSIYSGRVKLPPSLKGLNKPAFSFFSFCSSDVLA
jgi:hypothetical protein